MLQPMAQLDSSERLVIRLLVSLRDSGKTTVTLDDLTALVGGRVPAAKLKLVIRGFLDLGILAKFPPLHGGAVLSDLRITRLAGAYGQAGPKDASAESAEEQHRTTRGDRSTLERLALAELILIGPNATKIAAKVGVPRGTLLGWPTFRDAYDRAKVGREANKRSRRRGRRAGDRDFVTDDEAGE